MVGVMQEWAGAGSSYTKLTHKCGNDMKKKERKVLHKHNVG
jgi:hypothetical protein